MPRTAMGSQCVCSLMPFSLAKLCRLGGTVQQDFRFTCIDKHANVNTKINGLVRRTLKNKILFYKTITQTSNKSNFGLFYLVQFSKGTVKFGIELNLF